MNYIEGGITAPLGFTCNGVSAGIRANSSKKDLALIMSDCDCSAAAVYTKNKVCGAPIIVTRENIADGRARAIIVNSGNANTCNKEEGIAVAKKMCAFVEEHTSVSKNDVIVASTGVIGVPLPLDKIENAMEELSLNLSKDKHIDAAEAIMTTDTYYKETAVSFKIHDVECKIGAIAKGSGMIAPNMATMLSFITTDVKISPSLLQKALTSVVEDTFNMLSVDGDTSTNDTLAILANGRSGIEIDENHHYDEFLESLHKVCRTLVKMLARDGEGATKLVICSVEGAFSSYDARLMAKSVISSDLVKTAMFGADANWGRILCAIGYSDAEVDVNKVDVYFVSNAGEIEVCRDGGFIPFSEEEAKKILLENEITIKVVLHDGLAKAESYGCDLSYDYVKINGDYRT